MNRRGRQCFDLFNHIIIGNVHVGRFSNNPEVVADQILPRLQKLQHYQDTVSDDEQYKDFALFLPDDEDIEVPGQLVTNEVAAAIVDFFHREAWAGRRWKSLSIALFVSMEPLGRILEGARSSNLFLSCRIFLDYDFEEPTDHQRQSEERILQHFCRGNSSLEELEWESPRFYPETLRLLDEVLHDDSCKIKTLHLSCQFFAVKLALINVLEGCHSLESLHFARQCFDPNEGHRILNLVSTCPRLQEIHLSNAIISGGSFWGGSFPDQCSLDARKRLYRLFLPWNIVRPPWHAADGVSSYEQDINELLQVFPALEDCTDRSFLWNNADFVGFSLRTTQLLAFNYAGRAQLDQILRPRLWKSVLERVKRGTYNGMRFLRENLRREGLVDRKRALVLSCQASVLFSLFKNNPTVVTAEACRVQPPSTSRLSALGIL